MALFESCRILVGGHEVLRLFPLNQYSKFIKMMLQYDENYRTVHFYSLGELWKRDGLGVGIEVHILLLLKYIYPNRL